MLFGLIVSRFGNRIGLHSMTELLGNFWSDFGLMYLIKGYFEGNSIVFTKIRWNILKR